MSASHRPGSNRDGLTPKQDREGCDGDDEATLDTRVVDSPRRNLLCPEEDGRHDGDEGQTDHGDPDGDAVPLLNDDAQQEDPQRDFGDGHAQHGKRLSDHLVVDSLDCFVHGQGIYRLAEAVMTSDRDEDGIQEKEHLHRGQFSPKEADFRNGRHTPMPMCRHDHRGRWPCSRISWCTAGEGP